MVQLSKKPAHPHQHWWLDLIWVLLLSCATLFSALIIRLAVGLSLTVPPKSDVEFFAWLAYTCCWLAFVIMGHTRRNYTTYFPLSGLPVLAAMIATFLIP